MAGPFKISMAFVADTTSAKAGLAEVRKGLADVGTEVGKTRAATSAEARELEALAAAAARAAMSQSDLAAKMRQAQIAAAVSGVTGLDQAMARLGSTAATAADRARAAVSGLTASVARVWTDPRTAEELAAGLQARRAGTALDKSDLLIRLAQAGILTPAEAEEAATGAIPASMAAMLAGLPTDAQMAARIKWRSDTTISRTHHHRDAGCLYGKGAGVRNCCLTGQERAHAALALSAAAPAFFLSGRPYLAVSRMRGFPTG